MPYQMFGCAWAGMIAGLLPPLRGKAEIAMLAA
jgi:energy-coupling factor transport system substrate-specific component